MALDRKSEASLEPLGGDRHQIVLHNVAGVLEVGDKSEDLRQPAIVVIIERIGIEIGQIDLDRPVEAVEHVVEPLCRGDAFPVALIDRIKRAAKHCFENVGHAQRLSRCPGQGDCRAFAGKVVEIDRLRGIGRYRTRRQQPYQQPGEGSQQRQK